MSQQHLEKHSSERGIEWDGPAEKVDLVVFKKQGERFRHCPESALGTQIEGKGRILSTELPISLHAFHISLCLSVCLCQCLSLSLPISLPLSPTSTHIQ